MNRPISPYNAVSRTSSWAMLPAGASAQPQAPLLSVGAPPGQGCGVPPLETPPSWEDLLGRR
ncbi:MAG: hypothetical protein ACK46L_11440 [Synechococcaceae cyanobacterium]